jgi:hypothetical protein
LTLKKGNEFSYEFPLLLSPHIYESLIIVGRAIPLVWHASREIKILNDKKIIKNYSADNNDNE